MATISFDDGLGRGLGMRFADFSYGHATLADSRTLRYGDGAITLGDRIDLTDFDANALTRGLQDFRFIGGQSFSGRAGELRFAGGVLAGDTDGDGTAEFAGTVAGIAALTRADVFSERPPKTRGRGGS